MISCLLGANWLWGVCLAICLVPCAWAQGQPMASGIIVKLKQPGSGGNGVARPSALAFESTTRVQERLTTLSWRYQVPFVAHKQTAFAAHVLRAARPMPLAQAQAQAARLMLDPNVAWAIPNVIERPATAMVSNDPWLYWQTWLRARDTGLRGVANVPKAWQAMVSRSLSPVVIAVLDSGILPYADLAGRTWPGYDFVSEVEFARDGNGVDPDPSDPGNWLTASERTANPALYGVCPEHDSSWHGLSIASMLAAQTYNGLDGGGILAPLTGPVLLPVRVAGACGAEVSDIVEGMLWAAGIAYQGSPALNPHPARVINLSFGGDGSCAVTGQQDAAWLYRQTVAALKAKGTLVVASAGNGNDLGPQAQPSRPANCPGVLAVTALHPQGFKSSYANLVDAAAYPSLATHGGDVLLDPMEEPAGIVTVSNTGQRSPDPQGYVIQSMVGTSFAAPAAAGVAALMWAVDPNLSVDEVVAGLTQTALPHITAQEAASLGMPDLPSCEAGRNMGRCYCSASTCGAGRLDAEGAIQYALNELLLHPAGTGGLAGPSRVDYFLPSRAQVAAPSPDSSSNSGGGGATDSVSLAVLALLMALTLKATTGRR